MKAISLFSSAGIGELALKAHNIEIVCANEIISDRCELYKSNFPETVIFNGDIWDYTSQIVKKTQTILNGDDLFLVYATPPCQGMSSNGAGKLQSEIVAGNRSEEDQRNRLIIPLIEIVLKLRPRWILLENVTKMKDTIIRTDYGYLNIITFIEKMLGSDYVGGPEAVLCADFGIPQLRKRLITIYTRTDKGKNFYLRNNLSFFCESDKKPHVTLWDAIGHLPPLDGRPGKNTRTDFHKFHYVNVLSEEKYWWIDNTPEGETAFNNQCVNLSCQYQGNPRHTDEKKDGRWTSNKNTPIYCLKCGSLLPRPTTIDKKTGKRRLISGFHSAYRRMEKNKPSRTLTQNFLFEASDNKIHPTQNRVLSIYEALIIQTISNYSYKWEVNGKTVSKSLIAQVIGESVPPRLIDIILKRIIGIDSDNCQIPIQSTIQLNLF